MSKNTLSIALVVTMTLMACGSKPKVIQPSSPTSEVDADMQIEVPESQIHEVVVQDFLHASRYTYLNVAEDDESFWIAIPFTEVKKGETYYYQGGVRMHNFESKEHDRIFETLYLVGGVSKTPSPVGYVGSRQGEIDMHGGQVQPMVEKITPIEGGSELSEIFSNPEKYSDQKIKIKGQIVKVNRNIMGKNWIHLQDGSKDESDNNLDLTISTTEEIPTGAVVVIEGKIATNRDFGSGYRYDVMMEDAVVVN